MSSDERPTKIRKLSHEAGPRPEVVAGQQIEGTENETTDTVFNRKEANHDALSHAEQHPQTDVDLNADGSSKINPNLSEEALATQLAKKEFMTDLATKNPELSKNQLKKLYRQHQWESERSQRKVDRKDKLVAKRERTRAERDKILAETGMSLSELNQAKNAAGRGRGDQLPITFLIDCSYDDLMRTNEMVSLSAQITRSYGENRRARYRGHIAVSSFTGELRKRFDGVLNQNYKMWKGFKYFEEGFKDVQAKAGEWMSEKGGGKLVGPFKDREIPSQDEGEKKGPAAPKGEVIYLSSESENTLETLSPHSVYIVGGLVDKNREKGICYRRACEAGIKTAKLPIGEHLEMASRKILATNHVVEIMLKYLECGDWGKALFEVMPKRKGGQLKKVADVTGAGESVSGEQEQEEEEDEQEDDNAVEEPGEAAAEPTTNGLGVVNAAADEAAME